MSSMLTICCRSCNHRRVQQQKKVAWLHDLRVTSKLQYANSTLILFTYHKTACVTFYLLYTILRSFHSRKLHILGFLARIVVMSSRVIFFFVLSG